MARTKVSFSGAWTCQIVVNVPTVDASTRQIVVKVTNLDASHPLSQNVT